MTAVALHQPETQHRLPAVMQTMTPVDMLSLAVANGASIEVLERLITLQERWRAGEARRAFDAAIAAAKAEIKPIPKGRRVNFETSKSATNYDYEGLDDIANMVDPPLAKNGLCYRHRSLQDGPRLTITCVLTHKDGHFEETSLSAGNDQSGNKNAIQAVGSVATYLQRYTLKLALGLATTRDDDAQTVAPVPAAKARPLTITAAEADDLMALADEVGADRTKFCEWLGAASFNEIPASQFDKAKRALEAKRRQTQQSASAAETLDPAAKPADHPPAGQPPASEHPPLADAGGTPDPIEEARAAGRKACRDGANYEAVPQKYARDRDWARAWQEAHAAEGELMEAEMNQ